MNILGSSVITQLGASYSVTGPTGPTGTTGTTGPRYTSILSYMEYAGTPATYNSSGVLQPATIPATSYFYMGTT